MHWHYFRAYGALLERRESQNVVGASGRSESNRAGPEHEVLFLTKLTLLLGDAVQDPQKV